MLALDMLFLIVVLYGVYVVTIGMFGLRTPRQETTHLPQHRFAIIVPAHNEEAVIEPLLDSLEALNYPGHLYDVFVIADNCSDDTAEVAREAGARVLERTSQELRGKGHALRYALSRLGFLNLTKSGYDAAVIFDADNLVEPNFLTVMNSRLSEGETLIQCFLDSKNPGDTWISAAYSLMFWLNNRFLMLSRDQLGLSAAFMGTGMCISEEVLCSVGWDTRSLTEDLEYSMQALLQGYRTTYTHHTRVYDEKPLTLKASLKQRLRWARGQFFVLFAYALPLLWKGFADRSAVKFEGGVRLLQLLIIIIGPLTMVSFQWLGTPPLTEWVLTRARWLPFAVAHVPYLMMAGLFWLDNPSPTVLRYILLYPLFAFTWLGLLFPGLLTFRHRAWLPTEHHRALDLQAMEDVAPLAYATAEEENDRFITRTHHRQHIQSAMTANQWNIP